MKYKMLHHQQKTNRQCISGTAEDSLAPNFLEPNSRGPLISDVNITGCCVTIYEISNTTISSVVLFDSFAYTTFMLTNNNGENKKANI